MSQLSNLAENRLADFTRAQVLTLPDSWHLALGSAASDSSFTELTGTAYARVAVERSLTSWAGTQGAGTTLASNGTSHATSNNAEVDFGTAGSAWGSASYVGFFDAASAGNCWFWIELDTPLTIAEDDPVAIADGDIVLTVGLAGGMSDYLSNKLIDLLFRDQAFTWPVSLFAALFTAAPSNSGGGTEVSGGSYARAEIPATLSDWSGTQSVGSTTASSGTSGRISNNEEISYPVPTGNWGTITHEGLFDAATTGNLYWWKPLVNPKSVSSGASAPMHAPNSMGITFS